MMEANESKKVLSSSNKRLVIMGRFNATGSKSGASQGVTFAGRPADGVSALTVAEFFEQIRPEIRYERNKASRIGNTWFNSFSLKTPADAAGVGYGQAITEDSPLLQSQIVGDESTRHLAMQETGGNLFKALLEDLDEVVRFSDGRFSAALLKFTRRYMLEYAEARLKNDMLAYSAWDKLAFDHAVSASILNYMTCYRSDETNARTQVEKALNAHREGTDAPLTTERVTALMAGLLQCKRVSEAGESDESYVDALAKENGYEFVRNYAADPKYGISVPAAGGKGLLDHYRYFRKRSDAVHRFVRNGSLHSYLFTWLAGKYRAYNSPSEFRAVAEQLYAHGVEGQGDKRIPGETAEERQRNFELVRDTESTLPEAQRAQLRNSNVYERMQQVLLEGILEKLRPDRAFRRDALNKRNRELFVFLGQMAGGKAGQILNRATDKAGQLSRVYRAAKNVQQKEGTVLQAADFEKAFKRLRTGDLTQFIDDLQKEVSNLTLQGEELQRAVRESVVRRIAAETKTYFDQTWISDLDAIEHEVQELGDIYDLRNKIEVERRDDASLGMPMTVLTSSELNILAPVEASEADQKIYTASLQSAAGAAGAASSSQPAVTTLPVPDALKEAAATAQTGVIKTAAGRELATLQSEPERGVISATLKADATAEELLSSSAQLDFGALESLKVIDLAGLDLQPLVKASEKSAKHLESVARNFGTYSQTQTLVRDKYLKDRGDKGDTAFTRATRALALGEYMAATPPEESNLGVADLSNILGVALDMTEHIGEVGNQKLFAAGETLPADVLGRMNLSLHFPVNNAEELSAVLQHHATQCGTLLELGEYFTELRGIKSLFESLQGTDAEITVYNCTVADHASREVRFARDLFLVKEHPIAVYLTGQAQPAKGLSALGDRVDRVLKRRNAETEALQIPIVVTPADVTQDNLIFPVVSPKTVPLPALALAKTSAALDPGRIPCSRADVGIYLALAASLAVGRSGPELGKLSDIDEEQSINVTDRLLVNPDDGQDLLELLREAWMTIGSPLNSLLCMTKWLNICLLHSPQTAEHLTSLLNSTCLPALKSGSDPKQAEYVAEQAFRGLLTKSFKEPGNLMPQVFSGAGASTPISNQPSAVALTAGTLGVRDKTSGKAKNFEKLAFLSAFAAKVAAVGGTTGETE